MKDACSVHLFDWDTARERARTVRTAVFVVEQGVPIELEWDEWDPHCDHALALDPGGGAIGTGRLLPDGHIGRMAVVAGWRGRGVGGALLAALIARAEQRGLARALLNAQVHAAPFYRRFGFIEFGTEFPEAGIPHIAMAKSLISPGS
jgi:predicted GNAT family N-acyltransferase